MLFIYPTKGCIIIFEWITSKSTCDIISILSIFVPSSSIVSLNINKDEVNHTFLVPISYLMQTEPTSYENEIHIVRDKNFPYDILPNKQSNKFIRGYESTLFYEYENYVIWGITAKILENFIEFLKS